MAESSFTDSAAVAILQSCSFSRTSLMFCFFAFSSALRKSATTRSNTCSGFSIRQKLKTRILSVSKILASSIARSSTAGCSLYPNLALKVSRWPSFVVNPGASTFMNGEAMSDTFIPYFVNRRRASFTSSSFRSMRFLFHIARSSTNCKPNSRETVRARSRSCVISSLITPNFSDGDVARINAIPPSPAINFLRFMRSFSYALVAGKGQCATLYSQDEHIHRLDRRRQHHGYPCPRGEGGARREPGRNLRNERRKSPPPCRRIWRTGLRGARRFSGPSSDGHRHHRESFRSSCSSWYRRSPAGVARACREADRHRHEPGRCIDRGGRKGGCQTWSDFPGSFETRCPANEGADRLRRFRITDTGRRPRQVVPPAGILFNFAVARNPCARRRRSPYQSGNPYGRPAFAAPGRCEARAGSHEDVAPHNRRRRHTGGPA